MVAILSQYCINVSDLDRAIEFWEGVIGIPREPNRYSERPERRSCSRPRGKPDATRPALRPRGPIDMGNAMWKLYVNTDDCQALYDKALAVGCESVMAP